MKKLSLVCICLLSFQVFAAGKEKTVREPAAKIKKSKALTCSNAAGDGGYSITIFNYKRATILENNIAGAKQVANLNCGLLPKRKVGSSADMIENFLSCSGKGSDSEKIYTVVVSSGGFAGLTEADLIIDGETVAEDILCK